MMIFNTTIEHDILIEVDTRKEQDLMIVCPQCYQIAPVTSIRINVRYDEEETDYISFFSSCHAPPLTIRESQEE